MSERNVTGNKPIRKETSSIDTIKELLPARAVAIFTGLNAIILSAPNIQSFKSVATLVIFIIGIIWTLIVIINNNRDALKQNPPEEAVPPVQVVFTILTFMVWAAVTGGVLQQFFPTFWGAFWDGALVTGWTLLSPELFKLFQK